GFRVTTSDLRAGAGRTRLRQKCRWQDVRFVSNAKSLTKRGSPSSGWAASYRRRCLLGGREVPSAPHRATNSRPIRGTVGAITRSLITANGYLPASVKHRLSWLAVRCARSRVQRIGKGNVCDCKTAEQRQIIVLIYAHLSGVGAGPPLHHAS